MSPTSQPATKDRILDATADLFRRHGYTGTGLKQIVAKANAPFGSVYHHFPGGKQQLGAEVIERAGRDVLRARRRRHQRRARPRHRRARLLCRRGRRCWPRPTTPTRARSKRSRSRSRAPTRRCGSRPRTSSRAGSTGWPTRIRTEGIDDATARELSIMIITMLEGAFVLARASRTPEALEVAGRACVAAVAAALR